MKKTMKSNRESQKASDYDCEYQDVEFEAATSRLATEMVALRKAYKDGMLDKAEGLLNSVCRVVRRSKLVFVDVARSYGADYEDQYQFCVDLVVEAAEIAALTSFENVKGSLNRHANEIQVRQSEVKHEVSTFSDSDLSLQTQYAK